MIDLGSNFRSFSGNLDTYTVDYSPVSRPPQSFFTEVRQSVQLAYDARQAPMYICYSGGLDSEFVLHAFCEQKIPFTPVILKTQYNHHDIAYAIRFCENRNLRYQLIDLDFDHFVTSGKMLDICLDAKTGPGNAVLLWLYTQIDGSVITGEGDQLLGRKVDDPQWYVYEDENDTRIMEFRKKHQVLGPPFLLSCYTPEQMLSYLLEPVIVDLVNNRIPKKLSNVSSKARIYSGCSGYDFEARPKFHGFENTMESAIWQHEDIQHVLGMESIWNGYCLINYQDAVAKLSQGHNIHK